jgi:hypothetical protein
MVLFILLRVPNAHASKTLGDRKMLEDLELGFESRESDANEGGVGGYKRRN